MRTRTFNMTFNDYVDFINKNNMFDLIDNMNQLVGCYKPMTGFDFDANLASVEVIPSQSTIKLSMPGVRGMISRSSVYGMKNFSTL